MNQIRTITIIVVNGTAPLAPLIQSMKFRKKKTEKTMPGKTRGVAIIRRFHDSPPKDLYVREAT